MAIAAIPTKWFSWQEIIYIAMEQTMWQLVLFIVTLDKVLLELKKVLQTIDSTIIWKCYKS
jgi:hypothetical protein